MEEQKAKQDNRIMKGRHIAYVIYDYFKIWGTGEALLDFNDLLTVQLKNDNVQGFDTKWDEVHLSRTKVPDEDFLENCTRSSSVELKPLMALYLQDTVQKGEKKSLAFYVKQWKRSNDFKGRRCLHGAAGWKGNSRGNPKGNGKGSSKDRTHGDCTQWTSKGQCS